MDEHERENAAEWRQEDAPADPRPSPSAAYHVQEPVRQTITPRSYEPRGPPHSSLPAPQRSIQDRCRDPRGSPRPSQPALPAQRPNQRAQRSSTEYKSLGSKFFFPRVVPVNNALAERRLEKLERADNVQVERKQRRQDPDQKGHCATSGVFIWQPEDARTAEIDEDWLDELRGRFQATIVYDEKLSAFKATMAEPRDIPVVLAAIKVALSEYVSLRTPPLRLFFVEPLEENPSNCSILETPHKWTYPTRHQIEIVQARNLKIHAARLGDSSANRVAILKNRQAIPNAPREEYPAIIRTNYRCLEMAVEKSLVKLRYLRGFVKFQAVLAVFVFTRHLKPSDGGVCIESLDFIKSLREHSTEGTQYKL